MRSQRDAGLNLDQLRNGAAVVATDHEVGTVERIERGEHDGESKLIVRTGYSEHLVAITPDLVSEVSPGMVKLNVRRSDVEALRYDSDSVEEAGATAASPPVDSVLGKPVIEPPDGPATG